MTSGIYAIVNKENGHKYIGSAIDIKARWRVHLHHLRMGTHHSRHLQNAWDKHGEDNFVFVVLLECDRERLLDCEQACFETEHPEYNVYPDARSPLGHIVTAETRAKISAAKKGTVSPKRGIPLSEETKLKLSLSKKGCSNPHEGRKKSEDEKLRISLSLIGNKRACKK